MIADLSPGPRRTYQLPGRTGWRTGAASGKGSLLFVSGQTAEAVDGSVPRPTSHIKQAQLAYQNMGALLEQAGGSFADVLDFTSFHLDIRGAEPTFTEVYVPEVMGKVPVDIAATTSHVGSSGLQRPGVLAAYSAIADMRAGARTGSTPNPSISSGLRPHTCAYRPIHAAEHEITTCVTTMHADMNGAADVLLPLASISPSCGSIAAFAK